MALLIITYNSRSLCRSALATELIRSSPVSRTPLTHSSKSPVQSVIIGTRSTLPPLALTSPGQRRRNCVEEYFSGCPPASFEPCQATQGRRRGEGLRWKLAVPGPLWGTGGSAPPKGRRPKCGAGGGIGGTIFYKENIPSRLEPAEASITQWARTHADTRARTRHVHAHGHGHGHGRSGSGTGGGTWAAQRTVQ